MNDGSYRETLAVIASRQGSALNYGRIGRQLEISGAAVRGRVRELAEAGVIWLLEPLPAAGGRKTRKAPKAYLRNGTAQVPAPESAEEQELRHRSRMIRALCRLEQERRCRSTFHYYGGYGKTHVELVVNTSLKRIGFVFLRHSCLSRWCWSYCRRVVRQGTLDGAFVLYPGRRIFFAADRIVILPTDELLRHYRRWMNACLGASRTLLMRMVRAYNTAHAHRLY